jgi:hypothetical protein
MNSISGKLEYWAMLFMLSETVTPEWTDELYQMLQTEIPEVPVHGGCWIIIHSAGEMQFFRYRPGAAKDDFLDPYVHDDVGDRKLKVKDDGILIHRTFNLILNKDP